MTYMTPFERHQHEQGKDLETKPRVLPWAGEVMTKVSVHRGAYESPLKVWYDEENSKRRLGLINEIDINKIKAACYGVKNKWYERFKKNPSIFKCVIDNQVIDWQIILKGEEPPKEHP